VSARDVDLSRTLAELVSEVTFEPLPRPPGCPVCGDVAGRSRQTGAVYCGNEACRLAAGVDAREFEALAASLAVEDWRALPEGDRALLREPAAETFVERFAEELLRLGARADDVLAVAQTANRAIPRSARPAAVAEAVIRAATAHRRRGAA